MIFQSHFFSRELKKISEISKLFLRSQKYFWDLKNISEISTFFQSHFSPWRGFWSHFCDSTLEDWHPGVLVMFEKRFISLNWAIYDAFSLIKSLIESFLQAWKNAFIIYQWFDQTKGVINCPIQRNETFFKHH